MKSSLSIFDRIAIAGLVVAALFQAVDQAASSAPRLRLAFPVLDFSGAWNYLPIVLLTIAGVSWLIGQRKASKAIQNRQQVPEPSQLMLEPAQLTPEPNSSTVIPPRVFLDRTATPERLMEPYGQHLELHAKKLVQPFFGKWMAVSGVYWSASATTSGHIYVRFKNTLREYEATYSAILLDFGPEWRDRIEVLHKGDTILVVGELTNITADSIWLDNCELVKERDAEYFLALPAAPAAPKKPPLQKTKRKSPARKRAPTRTS